MGADLTVALASLLVYEMGKLAIGMINIIPSLTFGTVRRNTLKRGLSD